MQQDIKAYCAPHSPEAQIRSNVYNKPHHIAQSEPVFLRLPFMTFYPTLEINQASRNPTVVCFFIHPLEAETIFTTAPQQEQTRDIIKEIAIFLNSLSRGIHRLIHHHYFALYSGRKRPRYVDTVICMRKYVQMQSARGKRLHASLAKPGGK